MAAVTPKITISPTQEQVLRGLVASGGDVGFRALFRSAFGIRWEDVNPGDRNRYFSNLRALERKGLVTITRRWGTWGYGQPELVGITETGRTCVS